MKRQLCILSALVVSACLLASPAAAAESQHTGEILGTNPGERTLTLRVTRPEGKELVVFKVSEDAEITREGSEKRLKLEDLRPGARATVDSRREKGGRVAWRIEIRREAEEPRA